MNKAHITRDISLSANATHAVKEAIRRGIYTMSVTAQLTDAPDVLALYDAGAAAAKKLQAYNISLAIRSALASTTPASRQVVIIVYDRNRPNPYMKYGFTHNSVIVRDSWRLTEQTVQLIEDARRHRQDLDDLILHTCVTQQHGQQKFLIVICRGKDDYRRTFFKGKRKVPVHQKEEPQKCEAAPKDLQDNYMADMLRLHGNTVVDRRFIRRLGAEKTAAYLSEQIGEPVYLRTAEGDTPRDTYYIAETEKRRRRT